MLYSRLAAVSCVKSPLSLAMHYAQRPLVFVIEKRAVLFIYIYSEIYLNFKESCEHGVRSETCRSCCFATAGMRCFGFT